MTTVNSVRAPVVIAYPGMLALVAAVGGAAVACEQVETAQAPKVRPVKYQRVSQVGGPLVRTFSGIAEAGQESNLSFKVPGNITEIGVKVGDEVDKKTTIAKLDRTDYDLKFKQAKAAASNARAQRRNAKSAYNRVRALYANQNASKGDLDSARARSDSARAAASSAAQAVELAKQQLSYTRLKAPVAGAIAQVLVDVNENVSAGQPIVKLTSGDRPKVTVAVPEGLIARVERGSNVEVKFEAIADRPFEAEVTEVAIASSLSDAAFPVTVTLTKSDDDVRPGMAADVTFRFEAAENAGDTPRFIVPASAVGQDRTGRFIFVVKPTDEGFGTVYRRPVVVADELTREGLEVLEGVAEGDLVVTAGVSKLEDGLRVKVP